MSKYGFRIVGASLYTDASIHTYFKNLNYSSEDLHGLRDNVIEDDFKIGTQYHLENFRRGDDKTRSYILNALCAHRDAGLDACPETAALDFGREGCHEQNVRYYRDFLEHGKHRGQGHLFVGTLPTTPICEVAIALKLYGGIYYFNAFDRFDALWTEIEMQFECTPVKRVLVCNYTKTRLLTFLVIPGETDIPENLKNIEEIVFKKNISEED